MRIISPLLILLVVVVAACSKDKFTTIPQLKIKSIDPDVVFNGDVLSMKGEYTDQEGDIDSLFLVYKWYNGTTVVYNDTFRFPFETLDLPPKTREADISIDFEYNTGNTGLLTLPGVSIRDTTATLGLILLDKAKNRSVYAESSPIRLKKP